MGSSNCVVYYRNSFVFRSRSCVVNPDCVSNSKTIESFYFILGDSDGGSTICNAWILASSPWTNCNCPAIISKHLDGTSIWLYYIDTNGGNCWPSIYVCFQKNGSSSFYKRRRHSGDW